MNQHEKTLREALHLALQATGKRAKEAAFCEGEDALNALLHGHKRALASARAEGFAKAREMAAGEVLANVVPADDKARAESDNDLDVAAAERQQAERERDEARAAHADRVAEVLRLTGELQRENVARERAEADNAALLERLARLRQQRDELADRLGLSMVPADREPEHPGTALLERHVNEIRTLRERVQALEADLDHSRKTTGKVLTEERERAKVLTEDIATVVAERDALRLSGSATSLETPDPDDIEGLRASLHRWRAGARAANARALAAERAVDVWRTECREAESSLSSSRAHEAEMAESLRNALERLRALERVREAVRRFDAYFDLSEPLDPCEVFAPESPTGMNEAMAALVEACAAADALKVES